MRRKLFLSFITLMLLITVFTSSTYAWFKINSSALISGFDFQVHGGEGFVISADGTNFYNGLSKEQMLEAIVLGYDDETFEYREGNLVYKETGVSVTYDELNTILSNQLRLAPLTSNDGINFEDMLGADTKASSGKYIEFDLYFKTLSNYVEDKMQFEIYFNHENTTADDGTKVVPTTITANVSDLVLTAPMTTINGQLNKFQTVSVSSANAIRISVDDTTVVDEEATIYEFYDNSDLGSYATDYDGDDALLNGLYNANNNAMFTYYNNLKAGLTHLTPLSYDNMPKTIRYENNSGQEFNQLITTLYSGSEATKITFRIWIEGWDADCFDGLFESINVKLTFKGKRIY